MTERPIVVVGSYPELIAALRKRCDELSVPMETIDAIAGLPDRLTSKILAPKPQKFLGPLSWTMVEAMGLRIALVEDRPALVRLRRLSKWQARRPGARSLRGIAKARSKRGTKGSHPWLPRVAKIGGMLRVTRQSPARRKWSAKRAALARWTKHSARGARASGLRKAACGPRPAGTA
jgi:hypothetical protein